MRLIASLLQNIDFQWLREVKHLSLGNMHYYVGKHQASTYLKQAVFSLFLGACLSQVFSHYTCTVLFLENTCSVKELDKLLASNLFESSVTVTKV